MRALASPLIAAIAFLAGLVLTLAYATLVGFRVPLPFGLSGSPTGSPIATSATPVGSSSAPPATLPATATPNPGAPVVMVGAGDIAVCDRFQDEATADAVDRTPGIVFSLGDNVYPRGTSDAFRQCYGPSWGRASIKDRTRPTAGGNEYKVDGAADYFRYFGAAAGEAGKGYYAYEAGAWRVYVLNSNCHAIGGCQAGSAQEVWLRSDLAANSTKCILAMWHHPLFSSGQGGGIALTRALWRALDDAGAELVLNGNHHAYERFAAQDADGKADDRGIVEIVAGTGGAEPSTFGALEDNSVVRATGVYGVLKLELSPDSYTYRFLSTGGRDFSDGGSGTCH
jgi:hypothetical protein